VNGGYARAIGDRLAAVPLLCAKAARGAQDAVATKLILDRGTFGNSYALLRAIADRVAVEVDRLSRMTAIPTGGN